MDPVPERLRSGYNIPASSKFMLKTHPYQLDEPGHSQQCTPDWESKREQRIILYCICKCMAICVGTGDIETVHLAAIFT